ncbi:MAG: thiolase family protein [Myxococcota bacterium]|jgi:3-oxoadipyl-CoA thiolase|nr:thiolase family protein [Myxococcota bacterium]
MSEVIIAAARRTPIGRFQGGLSGIRPDDLAAISIRTVVQQTGIDPALVDDVFLGCANQAGEDNRNVARMALLLAGLPESVPGVTVNRLCASGLEAVNQAFRAARCGDGSLYIAGGVESMSRAPYSVPRGPQLPKAGNVTIYDTSLGWRYPNPKLESLFPLEGMGQTAENLVDRYGITREDQDAFALASHQKAVAAIEAGSFDDELITVELPPDRKGRATGTVTVDEGPRGDTSLEKLARLRPAFRREGGTVTAGNSSTLNDGSSALVIATADRARELGLEPLARLVSCAAAGVNPRTMGIGPVPASRKALELAGLRVEDMAIVELNEAFAAQSLSVIRELELDPSRVNVNGGAIALGHPLGCSGARILTTLIHALRSRGERYGLATLCVGVGQGVSTIVEAIDAL